ncbi:unnamed protein product [Miscanthus lutarioriparius]|uniref:Sacsin/Nov domain-containing protein n=1 Tax=Miscanthus lutarioriparius TaxID=422564 RepID=A0A811QLY2_9POAL|nr:unnamed protein product [Miscanthus lutarioriparius]
MSSSSAMPPPASPREHVERIRRERYYIGRGEQNPLAEDMHQAVNYLSQELYSKDVHFLMELVQNAEDNEYPSEVAPSLEFLITSKDITGCGASSTLLIFNNERGFSATNIESICRVGKSTKKGNRHQGYIGEKGIGFKSVFLISSQPHIFSNGYQIKFNEKPCAECNIGYIVPQWVESTPSLSDIEALYGCSKVLPTTIIILPLKSEKIDAVKRQLSSMHPEMLLFLTKIRKLSVREDNSDPSNTTVSEISISSEKNYQARKNMHAESYTIHLSAEGTGKDEAECENRVDKRAEIDEWVITLAFPHGGVLSRGKQLSPGIYAFLPTEMVTSFPFIIQADFLLASSREAILFDSPWNKGILECVPSAFMDAFVTLIKSGADASPSMSLPSMFNFLPVNSSQIPLLETVRSAINLQMFPEDEHFLEPSMLAPRSQERKKIRRYAAASALRTSGDFDRRLIFHRAVSMGLPFNHRMIRAELLDTSRYLLGERRGRGQGLRMRVSGRGGRHRHSTDAPMAPAPATGSICPDHGPGPCPSWLPRFCVEHGHGPYPSPAPEVAVPSNWAAPEPMEVEPAPPTPTPYFTMVGLRRARSRSPSTTAARRSAPTRLPVLARGEISSSRALDDAPPPPPLPTAPIPHRVQAAKPPTAAPACDRPGSASLTDHRRAASPTATPGQARMAARGTSPHTRLRAAPPCQPKHLEGGGSAVRLLESVGNGAIRRLQRPPPWQRRWCFCRLR